MPIVEVDLTADSPDEDDHEVNAVLRRISHHSRKDELGTNDATPGETENLARLFDQTLPWRIRGWTASEEWSNETIDIVLR